MVNSLGIVMYCIWSVKERIPRLQNFLTSAVTHRDEELVGCPIVKVAVDILSLRHLTGDIIWTFRS